VLTLVFLLVVVTLQPFATYAGTTIPIPVLIALLVCLIPTTIGALISSIGIAGMDRSVQHNVWPYRGARSRRPATVHTLLLDKTGTITLGNRQASEFLPIAGVDERTWPMPRSWPPWRMRPRRPLDRRARQEKYGMRGRDSALQADVRAVHRADAHVRRRPRRPRDSQRRRDAVTRYVAAKWRHRPLRTGRHRRACRTRGGTPLVVAERTRALGVIHLKDIVKGGMRERFAQLARWGSRPS
jgi:K+-transporting ATPase ATPase B chain